MRPGRDRRRRQDVTKYLQCAIVFEANDKADRLLTGEMFQVGQTWKIIDAPVPDDGTTPINSVAKTGPGGNSEEKVSPAMKPLFTKLDEIDRQQPGPNTSPALIARYNVQRADILEQIAAQVKAEEREKWYKQIADCFSAAVQNNPGGEKGALRSSGPAEGQDRPRGARQPPGRSRRLLSNLCGILHPTGQRKGHDQGPERLDGQAGGLRQGVSP